MSTTATEQGQSGGGRSAGAGAERGGGKDTARGREEQSTGAATAERVPPRLKERYRTEIAPALREEFSYSNVMQIPGLVKISVNMGVGEAARDAKLIEGAIKDLTIITGQKPAIARATKSIAQFKLREWMLIGAHVTL